MNLEIYVDTIKTNIHVLKYFIKIPLIIKLRNILKEVIFLNEFK